MTWPPVPRKSRLNEGAVGAYLSLSLASLIALFCVAVAVIP